MVVYFARSRISFYYMAQFLYNLEAREAALSRFLFEGSQVVSELHTKIRVDFLWWWGVWGEEFLPNDTWLRGDSSNSGSSNGCIIAFLSLFFLWLWLWLWFDRFDRFDCFDDFGFNLRHLFLLTKDQSRRPMTSFQIQNVPRHVSQLNFKNR